jgi:hypothetical protein
MKTKLLALLLVAGSSLFAAGHFSIGVGIGVAPAYGYYAPPPPPPVVSYAVPAPGPGYTWVGGYWYPDGPRYAWRAGYWARPPYARAYWIAPRYYDHRYYAGYWRR